jgi:hypothetical protein
MDRLVALMAAKGMGNINPQDPSSLSNLKFTVGRRDLNAAANDRFTPMPMMASANGNAGNANNGMSLQLVNGRLQFEGVTRLDGEYVILVPTQQGLVDPGTGSTGQQLGIKKTNSAEKRGIEWRWVFAVVATVGGMLTW